MVAALYWRRATTPGVVAGLVAGITTSVLFWQLESWRPFDMHEGVIGLLVHVPVLVVVSLLTAPQDEEHLEAYLGE